jgi:BCL2-like 1 (apoptosis regulator Bcl-X)
MVLQLNATDVTQYKYNFDQVSPVAKLQTLWQKLEETQKDIVAENEYLRQHNENLQSELKNVEERKARLRESRLEMNPNVVAYINERITAKKDVGDAVDSAKSQQSPIPSFMRGWLNLRSPVMNSNATEQIARQLGADIVLYKCMPNPPVAMTPYAKRMREVVDEILSTYEDSFESILDVLYLDEINGLQTLWNIAEEVFCYDKEDSHPHWGHVATLYAFGAYVAMHSFNTSPQMANFVGDFLGYYVSKKLGHAIDKHGGWVGVNN